MLTKQPKTPKSTCELMLTGYIYGGGVAAIILTLLAVADMVFK